MFPYSRSGAATGSWNGTVLVDKADATGTYYRRARTYDPSSARFTQEDPIGLAGGINEYGFASGDPANYGDPFGLCPDARDPACQFTVAGGRSPGLVLPVALSAFGQAISNYLEGVAQRAKCGKCMAAAVMGAMMNEGGPEADGIALRPDIELIGGRSGAMVPSLEGPANSYINGGGGRVFETDASGKVVRDISAQRVKVLEVNRAPNGETFKRFRKIGLPNDADLNVLRRMGVIK